MSVFNPLIRELGEQDYEATWHAMQEITNIRLNNSTVDQPDEIWLLQHPPVYTLGLNGKRKHILIDNDIPVIAVDRGGQVTYHGPGQLVVYLLIDLNKRGYGVNELVKRIEQAIIETLASYGIKAEGRDNAPGVYVEGKKIAALGLRVRKGFTYHGLSLNIDMDLAPFKNINPCGYPDLETIDIASLNVKDSYDTIQAKLMEQLLTQLA